MGTSIAQVRETMRRSRMRAAHEIAKREHTLLAVTSSAVLGLAEAKGHRLPAIAGIDGTVVFGTLALLAADHVGGSSGRMLQSIADGWLSIGSYKMGRAVGGAPIAGTDGSDAAAMDALLGTS